MHLIEWAGRPCPPLIGAETEGSSAALAALAALAQGTRDFGRDGPHPVSTGGPTEGATERAAHVAPSFAGPVCGPSTDGAPRSAATARYFNQW